jgi:hypothetical protein
MLSKSNFCKNAKKKDGLDTWCRDCKKKSFKSYAEKNKSKLLTKRLDHKNEKKEYDKMHNIEYNDKHKLQHQQYYQQHKEHIKKRVRQYSIENAEKITIRRKQYEKSHRTQIVNAKRKYKIENPQRTWAIQTRIAHKRKGHTINISLDDLTDLAKHTTHCNICNTELDWNKYGLDKRTVSISSPTLDRINNGGDININSIWILCMRCNLMKNAMPFNEYVEFCRMIVNKFGN